MKGDLLIVEDDAALNEVLAMHFEAQGFRAGRALSVADAREWLRGNAPDLVLLDQQLPDGTGYEFLGQLLECGG